MKKNKKMNKLFVCMLMLLEVPLLGAQDFILPKDQSPKTAQCSKNELKSSLGDVTKHAFDTTTHFAQILGNLQIEVAGVPAEVQKTVSLYKEFGLVQVILAQVQERFSQLAEKLVENKKPFKKASRQHLEEALATMQAVDGGLCKQEKELRGVGGRLKTMVRASGSDVLTMLHEVKKIIATDQKEIQGFYDRLNGNECLKNA